MTTRQVTELDFRMPEYRDAKTEDFEFRSDGKLVRKDRWETAIGSIRFLVGCSGREFEIPDVVEAVRKLTDEAKGWVELEEYVDRPENLEPVSVRLEDGSILRNVIYDKKDKSWRWVNGIFTGIVIAWQMPEV